MKKIFFMVVLAIGLIGCSVSGDERWHALSNVDRFTDDSIKMVTIGDFKTTGWLMTSSLQYYPFVGLRDSQLIFGIRSGGSIRVPVGGVQVRIDGNKVWDINPYETPVYLSPSQASMPNMSIPNGPDMAQMQKGVIESMAKNMSPFTATTGDKAKAIIKEMFAGKRMIYRSVGFNQPGSTEGECLIDESFFKAMSQIGITQEMLN